MSAYTPLSFRALKFKNVYLSFYFTYLISNVSHSWCSYYSLLITSISFVFYVILFSLEDGKTNGLKIPLSVSHSIYLYVCLSGLSVSWFRKRIWFISVSHSVSLSAHWYIYRLTNAHTYTHIYFHTTFISLIYR